MAIVSRMSKSGQRYIRNSFIVVGIPANREGPQYADVTVTATDADAGVNAEIKYSILEAEARDYFQVRHRDG